MESKWINAWIDVAYTEENIEFIAHQFNEHNIDEYIISHETDPRDHYHLVGFTNRKNWDNTMKTFIDRWSLRTKRGTGKIGGKVKYGTDSRPVSHIEKLKSYILKQTKGDFTTVRSKNINTDELMKLYEQSYEKKEKKKLFQLVFESFEITYSEPEGWDRNKFEFESQYYKYQIKYIKLQIINYLRTTDTNMCRSNIDSYTQYCIKKTQHIPDMDKSLWIYYLFF